MPVLNEHTDYSGSLSEYMFLVNPPKRTRKKVLFFYSGRDI